MRFLPLSLLIALTTCLATARADELSDEEKQAGFKPMFNGRDFDGWMFTGVKDPATVTNWKVVEGVIHLTGGGKPHLATKDEYANFEMRFEWRALREKYNSGFFIRSNEKLGPNQINLAKGSEGKFIRGDMKGSEGVPDLQKKPGEWNEWRLLAEGESATFWCNGKLAWKGTGLKPAKGHIGLQAEGAPLEFRHLRIRRIEE